MQADTSLDDLFKEARRAFHALHAPKVKAAPIKKVLPDASRMETAAKWTDPDNWVAGRGIALIHRDSNTLLGNFQELTHRHEAGCRRLVRADSPISILATEYTEWLPASTSTESVVAAEPSQKRVTIIIPIFLDKLSATSPIVEVVVCLSYGNIARVELAVDTQFSGGDDSLIELRAGVNILPVMAYDSKINLRIELNKKETL
mgnify:CR=1 FL=1